MEQVKVKVRPYSLEEDAELRKIIALSGKEKREATQKFCVAYKRSPAAVSFRTTQIRKQVRAEQVSNDPSRDLTVPHRHKPTGYTNQEMRVLEIISQLIHAEERTKAIAKFCEKTKRTHNSVYLKVTRMRREMELASGNEPNSQRAVVIGHKSSDRIHKSPKETSFSVSKSEVVLPVKGVDVRTNKEGKMELVFKLA